MTTETINKLKLKPQAPVAKPWTELGANSHNQGDYLLIPEPLHQMYGADALQLHKQIPAEHKIPATPYYKAELNWALAHLGIIHLDDLLLRRTRIGLLHADGGASLKAELEQLCEQYLYWDSAKFEEEWQRYQEIHQELHQAL